MLIKTADGRPPRSERMTGLDQGQVDWLYEQLAQMAEWEASTGRPRVLPLLYGVGNGFVRVTAETGFRRSPEDFPAALRTVTKLEVFRVYGLY
ncbi:hypothetical protein [Microbispora sp. H10670]|uniref:hypothetical protein n=1 Tax=Microbispora sp. H10670 TaxID=2729108 RepID=UPI00160235C1|nr:hypothetical protein [Microbispora sp. H10670]